MMWNSYGIDVEFLVPLLKIAVILLWTASGIAMVLLYDSCVIPIIQGVAGGLL